ncbi:MAG TPA: hypothetical protein VN709_05555 [Terriglobales bacterium]|nr:hypothetical protein [Terriglobales bacterium]
MTLLDAKQYDFVKAQRRKTTAIVVAVVVVLAIIGFLYYPRYMARRTVNHFFQSLVAHNYMEAYAIWQANPKLYPMDTFMQDWGPSSKWGIIKTYHIDQLGTPPGGHASGLVALVDINGISTDDARIWIQNGTRELSFYQF